ncbi:hypothetical protein CJF12_09300 [Chryseobacterium piperi]|nr:hypothetical protein CJF12_09300 [Chryseobacterium piperi]
MTLILFFLFYDYCRFKRFLAHIFSILFPKILELLYIMILHYIAIHFTRTDVGSTISILTLKKQNFLKFTITRYIKLKMTKAA